MNEFWFFTIALLDLAVVLFAWRLGKEWVFVTIVVNIILTNTFAAKLIPIFGLVTDSGNVFYAAVFIATDILTEHHGKRDGYRSVWMGFLSVLLFIVMGQLVLRFTTIGDTQEVASAMGTLFGVVPRIAGASLIAYVISQNFDIWFYHFLHDKIGPQKLWLRNNLSTSTSQFIDSVIFFSLAFAGTVPFSVLLTITFTGYLLKLIVAVLDTPFIYLSYVVKGLKPPDFYKDTAEKGEAQE